MKENMLNNYKDLFDDDDSFSPYEEPDMNRPNCINPGCGRPATPMKGRVGQPGVRYRIFCDPCHRSSYSGTSLAIGVTPFKTGICSNKDGQLGFACLIKWELVTENYKVCTEVDHINGDPHDNRPENLQELCPICHREKGRRQGDYNGYR